MRKVYINLQTGQAYDSDAMMNKEIEELLPLETAILCVNVRPGEILDVPFYVEQYKNSLIKS